MIAFLHPALARKRLWRHVAEMKEAISYKTVLVTGAAHRIGAATARALAADGWAVGVHYHQSELAASALAQEIRENGGTAFPVRADLLCESDVESLIPRTAEILGPLGALVNNASLFEQDDVDTVSRASWDRHMETNLRAPFVLIQHFARQTPVGAKGVVINIADQRVLNLTPHFTSYTLSKAGLWALTQTMALALAPAIRVNAIGPGPTLPSIRQSREQFEQQCKAMPLMQGATPEEIADTVKFIIGAKSMTGAIITLDGGQHLLWAPSDSLVEE